jgi:urease accessory protein
MAQALSFVRRTQVSGTVPDTVPDTLTLTATLAWHEREKSRLAVITTNNEFVSIVLARGETLSDGDLLQTEDGAHTLRICAKEEPVLRISAPDSLTLTRLVYHLANRHVKMMLKTDAIFIESDPVLHSLAISLGGHVQTVHCVFEPERGAYSHSHAHGHSHAHDHSHDHSHHHDLDPQDYAQGQVGEELSRLAHARRQAAEKSSNH